jgi:hypothetical protein
MQAPRKVIQTVEALLESLIRWRIKVSLDNLLFLPSREQTRSVKKLESGLNVEKCQHSSYTANLTPIYDRIIGWLQSRRGEGARFRRGSINLISSRFSGDSEANIKSTTPVHGRTAGVSIGIPRARDIR